MKQKLKAMGYLGSLPKYKLIHKGHKVELYHYGLYGWCSGGSYNDWKLIETVWFHPGIGL